MTRLSEPRSVTLPDRSTVYQTSSGWRAQSPGGRKSPLFPTRRDVLHWLERQRNREQTEVTTRVSKSC